MQRKYLLGCDPEGFLFDTKANRFIGAEGIIKGDKFSPYYLDTGMMQVDGLAAEFGIAPAATEDEFVYLIGRTLEVIRSTLPEGVELRFVPTADFDPEVMAAQSPENLELGCTPDFSAYTREPNPKPRAPRTMRSAGGHVHIGWTFGADPFEEGHYNECCDITKLLDKTLGQASLEWDSDQRRRKLYGAWGSFRPKPYGLEYRPLSCAWVQTEALQRRVYSLTVETLRRYDAGERA